MTNSISMTSGSSILPGNEAPVLPSWTDNFLWIKRTRITRYDIFLIGMTVAIGGQLDIPYHGDYWSILFSIVFSGIGYVLLTFCLAEMTSTLPFSGGIYGFVRAFTNPIFGFYAACFELLLNLFYVSSHVHLLAQIPIIIGLADKSMSLVFALLIYLFILGITLIGGKLFWLTNTLLGATMFILLVIYIFGSMPSANFDHWAISQNNQSSSSFHFVNVLQNFPFASNCFLGIQFLPLTSRCAPDPKKDIPIVMCITITVMLFISIGLLTLSASQSPGLTILMNEEHQDYPLLDGFANIFHIQKNNCLWFYFIGRFAISFGFIFCYGRQASTMAKSALLPEMFLQVIPFLDTPYVTLLLGCSLGMICNIILYYSSNNDDKYVVKQFQLIAAISSYIVFIAALSAYIIFHKKYSSLPRYFSSPFNTKGAYLGILIFMICLIGTIGFENDDYIPIVFVIIASICIFFYFLIFMRSKLVFSEEEKDELFKAYLINANLATKAKMKKTRVNQWNNKVNPSGGAGSFQQKKSKEEPSSHIQVRNSLSNSVTSVHPPPPVVFNGFLEKENAFLQATPTTDPLAQSAASTTTNQASCTSSSTLSQKVVKYFNTKMNSVIPLDQDIVSLPQLSQQEQQDHYHPPHHYHQSTPYVEKELHANGKSHPMEEIIDNSNTRDVFHEEKNNFSFHQSSNDIFPNDLLPPV